MGSASKTPHMQGGFATIFDAVPEQCVKVPDHVSYQAAALAEPLAVCLHAVARAGDVRGKSAVLFGAGPIGLLTMLAARRAGLPKSPSPTSPRRRWHLPAGSAPIMSSISRRAMLA